MICLWCQQVLAAQASSCERCGTVFVEQPPIVGINHLTQLLQALQDPELDREELSGVVRHFVQRWEAFETRWSPPFRPQLPAHLGGYGDTLTALDRGLELGREAFAEIDSYLSGETESTEAACERLRAFFGAVCNSSAQLLEKLESPAASVLEELRG